jgi:hypothetical protein
MDRLLLDVWMPVVELGGLTLGRSIALYHPFEIFGKGEVWSTYHYHHHDTEMSVIQLYPALMSV